MPNIPISIFKIVQMETKTSCLSLSNIPKEETEMKTYCTQGNINPVLFSTPTTLVGDFKTWGYFLKSLTKHISKTEQNFLHVKELKIHGVKITLFTVHLSALFLPYAMS